MEQVVILSKLEQEYLLRVIEAAVQVREPHQLFLWSQGQLQALLPHQAMVCLQFDATEALVRLECLHGTVLAPPVLAALADPVGGLALRMARHCRDGRRLPAMTDIGLMGEGEGVLLAGFQDELRALGFENVLMHGSGRLDGGATMFALFGLPGKPGARQAYFLDLLLAHMHLALLRLPAPGRRAESDALPVVGGAIARPLSAREAEILRWVREGKSNYEVGRILGISALTVKNHLQRIYRTLGVSNRAHALARCMALRLLEAPEPY